MKDDACICRRHAVSPRCPRHGWGWRVRLGIATATAYFVMVVLAVFTAPADGHYTAKPGWMSKFAWAVAVCETGKGHTHPDFRHRGSKYGGAWGWFIPTWQLDRFSGMPRYPWLASPRQQYRVFLRGRERGRYWGCIANGGYRVWM